MSEAGKRGASSAMGGGHGGRGQMRGAMGGVPMGGGPMGGMSGAKARDFKKTMARLVAYLSEYKVKIFVVMVLAVCSTVFSIAGPKLMGGITTMIFSGLEEAFQGGALNIDFALIARTIAWMIGLYALSSAFSYAQGRIMAGVSTDVTYRLRKEISEKINRMPLRYFDTQTHGEVLSRITNDVDTVSQSLSQSLTQIITSAVTVVGVLAMMISINLWMTLLAVTVIPLSTVAVMLVVKRSQGYFRGQQQYIGEINGHVEEIYSGHDVVQAFNGEKDAIEKFEDINDKMYSSAWKAQFLSGLMMPITNFIGNVGYVLLCILGGYLAVRRAVEVGDIQAFVQYMRSFMQPLTQLANISNTLQSTAAAAERVFEFLSEAEESAFVPAAGSSQVTRGSVKFEHVRFGYTEDKVVIRDFSAEIGPGQRVAIVGPTGTGKTTIVKLLMRFYDIGGGKITIDGVDTYDLSRSDLRKMFGMVLQDTWLYNASIRENIRYGTFDATDEQVVAAAKAAHCDEFIHSLPGGYDMVLNEEASNISQGQKQLLTIARVFLADPKILILDEATSSVDTRTEVLIQKAMAELMKNKTSFVIAHRLSTVRDAQVIFVMRNGDIVEQGSHDELLAMNGFYAELYNSQFSQEI